MNAAESADGRRRQTRPVQRTDETDTCAQGALDASPVHQTNRHRSGDRRTAHHDPDWSMVDRSRSDCWRRDAPKMADHDPDLRRSSESATDGRPRRSSPTDRDTVANSLAARRLVGPMVRLLRQLASSTRNEIGVPARLVEQPMGDLGHQTAPPYDCRRPSPDEDAPPSDGRHGLEPGATNPPDHRHVRQTIGRLQRVARGARHVADAVHSRNPAIHEGLAALVVAKT